MDDRDELRLALERVQAELRPLKRERDALRAELEALERERTQLAGLESAEDVRSELAAQRALVEQRRAQLAALKASLAQASDPLQSPANRKLRDQLRAAHDEIKRLRARLR